MLVVLALTLLFTDRHPLVAQPGPPGAEQASAIKQAIGAARTQRLPGKQAVEIRLTREQLAAVGTLASDGFKPDRLLVRIHGKTLNVAGSHRLFFGRWLNARLVSQGSKTGFPKVYLTVGSVSFPAGISRFLLEGVRLAINLRGANVPPLDTLVQSSEIKGDEAIAKVHLPLKSGIVDQFAGARGGLDGATVIKVYCRLTALQTKKPTDDLAIAVQRAFPAESADTATVASNRAAFVALAMFTVSPRVGELAGLVDDDTRDCAKGPFALKLNGRFDLSKHWALSAALAVTAGARFSQAMGEWKELSDSVSKLSQFAEGDPTGFSFLDLAADRSGFLMAQAAMDPDRARSMAAKMSKIGPNDIVPASLMRLEDGMPESAFAQKYGTIRDPRFLAKIREIDAELNKSTTK